MLFRSIAATLAQESFWLLDAPVERLAPKDIPVAYHEALLAALMPGVEEIAARIEAVLSA